MTRPRWTLLGLAALLSVTPGARAADPDLQQKLEELSRQVEALKQQTAKVAELSKQVEALKRQAALTAQAPPRESRVAYMSSTSRAHITGYGAVGYTDAEHDNGRFQQVQFSPIFHYLYGDIALMEAELEITNAPSGETETDLEYATVDVFATDHIALFGGKFLSPLGRFRQNLHPSWVNKLPSAPLGFGHDGAAPLGEVGLGLRGGAPLGGDWRTDYALYLGNGPTLVTEGDEFNMASEGSTSDVDHRKVVGGRIGLLPPLPNTEIGLSAATGKLGTADEADPTTPTPGEPTTRDYDALGVDFVYHYSPRFELQGEYIQQRVGADGASAVHPDSLSWRAAYLQAAYQFDRSQWEGVLRWGEVDTPNEEQDQDQWAVGLNYLFSANVIGKLAYEVNHFDAAEVDDANALMAQFAFGF